MLIPTIGPEKRRQVTQESSEQLVEPSRLKGVGDSVETIAGAAQDAAMVLYKAGKARDNLRAENIADVAQSKALQDLNNEKDFSPEKTAEYKARLQKHDSQAANLISNPTDRQNFILQREAKRNITSIQIENIQERRMVEDYKAQMSLKASTGANAYIQTDFSPLGNKIRQTQVAELAKMMRKGLETGVYASEAQMEVAQKQILDQWHQDKVAFDINKDPALTAKRLDAGVYNSILSAEQVLVAKEQAQKQITANYRIERAQQLQQKQATIQRQHDTLLELGESAMAGDPNLNDKVNAAIKSGDIDTDTGFYLRIAAASPEDWSKFVGTADAKGNTPAAGAGAAPLIEAVKGLEGSPEERTKLLKTALQNLQNEKSSFSKSDLVFFLRTAAGKNADPQNPIWGWMKSAVSAIGNVQSLGLQGVVKDKFVSQWDMKSDPRPVVDKIVQDAHQEAAPATSNLVVGKQYRQGKFVGYHPKTGNLLFE